MKVVKLGLRYRHEKVVTIGQANKEDIFEIIIEKGPISARGIYKLLCRRNRELSMRTIYTHLDELVKERIVYKNEKGKATYVALDLDLGYLTTFAKNTKDALGFMVSPHLLLKPTDHANSKSDIGKLYLPKIWLPPSASDIMDTSIYEDFCNRVAGISVSKSVSKVKITKGNINSIYLFEFANRIGAYIIYLFIESMRPVNFNMKESTEELQLQRRHILSQHLLQIAINLEQMFSIFHNLLYNTNQTKKSYPPITKHKPLFFELKEENYNKISKAFKKVYPGIYDGLERYWQDTTRLWLINQIESKESFSGKKINCNHSWNRVHIFKLKGEYYHCRRCNNVVDGHYYRQLVK
jgi:predicted transcriptional regulator